MKKEDKVFFTGLIKGLEGRFDGLEKRFNRLEDWMESNSRGIRHSSMLVDIMQHDIKAIKKAVSSHSLRISSLEAKCG